MNVEVVSGTVRIKQPGRGSSGRSKEPAQIRMGSIIDATKGRVRVTTAAGGGKTQTADFYDGIFKIIQTKGKRPITDLRWSASSPAALEEGDSAAAKKRKGRRLWGKGKGRFRTRGKRSSALVRGTTWLVEDRCNDTTLTRVRAGAWSRCATSAGSATDRPRRRPLRARKPRKRRRGRPTGCAPACRSA